MLENLFCKGTLSVMISVFKYKCKGLYFTCDIGSHNACHNHQLYTGPDSAPNTLMGHFRDVKLGWY